MQLVCAFVFAYAKNRYSHVYWDQQTTVAIYQGDKEETVLIHEHFIYFPLEAFLGHNTICVHENRIPFKIV